MKKYLFFITTLFFSYLAYGNTTDPDSLVTYKVIVLDKFSGSPIKGVNVQYKKLPYQSEIGLLSTDQNGEVEAYFRARESYSPAGLSS